MDGDDDLDLLTELLAENEAGEEQQASQEAEDNLDDLFDNDDGDEEYREGLEGEGGEREEEDEAVALFGDVDGIEEEEEVETQPSGGKAPGNLNKSQEDLQEELRRMQEQMQRLQQQLEASQKSSTATSTPNSIPGTKAPSKANTPSQGPPKQSSSKPVRPTQKTKPQAVGKPSSAPDRGDGTKLQESSDFTAQLNNADLFKRKGQRTAHQVQPSTTAAATGTRGPLVEIKTHSSFQPIASSSRTNSTVRSSLPSQSNAAAALSAVRQANPLPSLPKDVAIEKYSGLRLRRPRVSSTEMDRKMADRKLIRLSQLPERLAREKLDECDWVTFAVLVNKATPQSNSSGKTFSIWKLSDLHDLEVYVSLFLFGEVHKEHWKTEPGTVMGILNPNPMKAKDGYDGVSLSVDHHQKLLLMGEAQDYGTCKAAKKNGDPCSQIVNLYECQYCQYHVKAQYKKMSAQRAELQSSFSGKATGKAKGKGNSLKERLCQTGFHYGGMSSPACAAALSASGLKKPTQTTLGNLFVKGSAHLASQAKRLAMKSNEVSGCSDDFKDLLSMPTPGALQLKRHLTKPPGSKGSAGAGVQSISASDLLKQQKQQQKQLLENRRRRAEEIQQRVLQNTGRAGFPGASPPSRGTLLSPKSASEVPKVTQSPTAPHTPTLGRGFNTGDDILFFDHTPPPPPTPHSLSAAKLAALKKLRVKGAGLAKEDPNAVKRKRSNSTDITTRVQKNLSSPDGEQPGAKEEEPAQKKRREEMDYVQSEEFKKILNAKSRHGAELQAAEYQQQESYFDPLVKKEAMEDKMRNIREQKCRAVSCKKCKYTYFKPADRCVEEKHELQWHDATKRFFKCPCGQRAIALDRLPHKHCSNCGLFKWERDGMLKEKSGPKIAGELLQPRGDEQPKFLNSMQ
ncbi:protein MCM10 homolog [Oncorhynchus keta]|uniref:protein MCM10 homolog n=1 Tax=Oncorhynchus keta TaxID=8018 RepID=UPI0015FA9D1F|nr:protein MCM10 homolog [Oncorhynchus keta]XP_035640252.1 protein MCM10 homolog [Oncorhynchus keta]